ncbi:nicotinate-nucleotide adenylyltransferase [Carnimonas nigrificans]|uniref:nicotinate-nucleotide adenylyltransferase n=1 Tax=Carnimonas nigrificans TaxID=64323 RepID=UPI000471C446|nr:nicotinate-nucleotide adenylyltransferase [Carnimonas nigrificans]
MAEHRVAMFGGTFDPIHIGHLRSAVELREVLGIENVHMIVNRLPPHRETPGISADDRLAMVRAGVGDTPGLIADAREVERDGPSWSLLTLQSLREEYGVNARLVMAIGMDSYRHFDQWYQVEALFDVAHVVVIDRPGSDFSPSQALLNLVEPRQVDSVEALFSAPCGHFMRLTLPSPMDVSATDLRGRIVKGQSIRYLVPEQVEELISQQRFYRAAE